MGAVIVRLSHAADELAVCASVSNARFAQWSRRSQGQRRTVEGRALFRPFDRAISPMFARSE